MACATTATCCQTANESLGRLGQGCSLLDGQLGSSHDQTTCSQVDPLLSDCADTSVQEVESVFAITRGYHYERTGVPNTKLLANLDARRTQAGPCRFRTWAEPFEAHLTRGNFRRSDDGTFPSEPEVRCIVEPSTT